MVNVMMVVMPRFRVLCLIEFGEFVEMDAFCKDAEDGGSAAIIPGGEKNGILLFFLKKSTFFFFKPRNLNPYENIVLFLWIRVRSRMPHIRDDLI